jgi:hypothetical protein
MARTVGLPHHHGLVDRPEPRSIGLTTSYFRRRAAARQTRGCQCEVAPAKCGLSLPGRERGRVREQSPVERADLLHSFGDQPVPYGQEPEQLGRFFVERANAGDVDGIVALYEPDAVWYELAGNRATVYGGVSRPLQV